VPVPIPVQQGNGTPASVHFWHVPVPAPVQQGSGALAAVHVLFGSLCGHPFDGSPSKQPVLAWSRQNPQKTRCSVPEATAVLLEMPVVSANGMGSIPMGWPVSVPTGKPGGGQSWLVGYGAPRLPLPGSHG